METMIRKIATRWLEAGIFEAPSSVRDRIQKWMLSQFCALIWARAEEKKKEPGKDEIVAHAMKPFLDQVALLKRRGLDVGQKMKFTQPEFDIFKNTFEFKKNQFWEVVRKEDHYDASKYDLYVDDLLYHTGDLKEIVGFLKSLEEEQLGELKKYYDPRRDTVNLALVINKCRQYTSKPRFRKNTVSIKDAIQVADIKSWKYWHGVDSKTVRWLEEKAQTWRQMADHHAELFKKIQKEVEQLERSRKPGKTKMLDWLRRSIGGSKPRKIQIFFNGAGKWSTINEYYFYIESKEALYESLGVQRFVTTLENKARNAEQQLSYVHTDQYIEDKLTPWKELTFKFTPRHLPGHLGFWNNSKKELLCTLPREEKELAREFTVPNLNAAIEHLKSTCRHEAQHLAQSLLKDLNDLSEIAGLPSKSIRPEGPDSAIVERKRGLQVEWTREHTLRNIEFYTRLADETRLFESDVKKIPRAYWKQFFEIWIDKRRMFEHIPNPDLNKEVSKRIQRFLRSQLTTRPNRDFFKDLKKEQPRKWNKAVGILYDEIRKKGIRF